MVRKLMLLLAFLAVFGQALASSSLPRLGFGEFGHVLAHAQEDGHHHHDDGDMHADDADEGGFHVHLDGANSAALPAATAARPAPTQPKGQPRWEPRLHLSPTIDGLLKPPKLAS